MFFADRYDYATNNSFLDYEFESIGPKGIIKKVARFIKIAERLYNFGFGDLNETTGVISDTTVSNNNDGDKVLRTVAAIIFHFTGAYMDAAVFIKGTNAARTRRYQMGLSKYWEEIEPVFEVFGLRQDETWEPFRKGANYEAFLGRRKTSFYLDVF